MTQDNVMLFVLSHSGFLVSSWGQKGVPEVTHAGADDQTSTAVWLLQQNREN